MPFESTSNWTSTLGTPRGAGGMPSMQLEVAELLIVLGHRALPLEDLDLYAGLVVGVGGECLRLLAGDRAVALDELRHHAAHRLQAEAERRDIQQHQILNALALDAVEDGRLDGRAVRHGLVGVDPFAQLLAVERLREHVLHGGDAGGAADQHDLIYLCLGEAAVLEHALDQLH